MNCLKNGELIATQDTKKILSTLKFFVLFFEKERLFKIFSIQNFDETPCCSKTKKIESKLRKL